jgi:hypothetical protein
MVKHKSGLVTSSNRVTVYLLAVKAASKQPPHEAFANLQDSEDAVRAFRREWGPISKLPMVDAGILDWRDTLRKAWEGNADALDTIQRWNNLYMMTSLKFDNGRIVMESEHLLGTIHLLFLRDHLAGKAAICGNPDCAQRYFVKRRGTQRFCEARGCSEYAQREYARKWWHQKGDELRAERRKQAQTKGRKK